MRKIAIGLAAAAVLATAPAVAQIGFYAGPNGGEVGVPGPQYRCGYDYPCRYRDDGPVVRFGFGPGRHDHWRR